MFNCQLTGTAQTHEEPWGPVTGPPQISRSFGAGSAESITNMLKRRDNVRFFLFAVDHQHGVTLRACQLRLLTADQDSET